MIRRGFWLVTGAVIGVAGYRRMTRLARALNGDGVAGRPQAEAGLLRSARLTADPVDGRTAVGGARQVERRPRPGTIARIAATVSFVRDVRAGMAEYLDLRRPELARSLMSRSDRISSGRSGASGQGAPEP